MRQTPRWTTNRSSPRQCCFPTDPGAPISLSLLQKGRNGLGGLEPSTNAVALFDRLSLVRVRETGGMPFLGSVEFSVDVANLGQAEQVVRAAEQAAYAALGGTAIDDPESRAVSGHFYEPIDDVARAALDKEDLGHGISGRTFRY